MSFARRLVRWLIGIVASLVSAVAFGGVVAWFFLQSSLPQTEGRIFAAGLRETVSVVRDADGVPHISARNTDDAYFTLGYVHAQDRLWQMEATRRAGAGRLSEMLGRQTLGIDRTMRVLGLYRNAERIYDGLAPEVRRAIDAYADGVNAYIDAHVGAWPIEFYLLGLRPEPWRPADSLVWGQLMTLRLSGDWRSELARQRLATRLRPEQIEQLLERPSAGGPVTVEEPAQETRKPTPPETETDETYAPPLGLRESLLAANAAALPDWFGPGTASNSWSLSGARTTSGKPLLANDPHLGLELPAVWYLARIDAPGLSISGATAPGVPFHVIGHNARIAWGLTTTGSDVQDLFVERTDPADAGRYLTPEGSVPFIQRRETIGVRGADDDVLIVRETRHGPVVSDLATDTLAAMPAGDVLAFAAAGLREDDRTPQALFRLNHAQGWDDFIAAMRDFHSPQQNVAYADVDGNIGIYVAGRVPVRKQGEGLFPVPGWTGEYDWTGFIPFDELPHSRNPVSGRIANANNRVVRPGYPYPLGRDWTEPFRIERIEQLLAATERHDADSMTRMQGDVKSLVPEQLLPLMLPALRDMPLSGGRYAEAIALLDGWNGEVSLDAPQPLIFTAWLRQTVRLLAADELGPLFQPYWRLQAGFVAEALAREMRWCDDIVTPEVETCELQLQRAFIAAMGDLSARFGDDPKDWLWRRAHIAPLVNRVLSRVPLLNAVTDAAIPTPGDDYTVNRGSTSIRSERDPYAHVHGPGLRAVYDLADLDASRFIIAGGQSGNPLSRHYDDLTRRWRDLGHLTLGRSAGTGARTLVLVPAP